MSVYIITMVNKKNSIVLRSKVLERSFANACARAYKMQHTDVGYNYLKIQSIIEEQRELSEQQLIDPYASEELIISTADPL